MCGLAGVFAYHYAANDVSRDELLAMREHMAARGPDGAGLWIDPDRRIGLAHRRLAIIDLTEAAAQPLATPDGSLIVAFNGEIYNFRALRARLEAKGFRFRTTSDTEVLLHLYADRGADMVEDLRGMFAFAIFDARRRALFLARDPYGVKPLYYSDDGWTFRFASQVKALLAGGGVSCSPEPAGHAGFYLFGAVPEPFTLYRDIRALPAGATLHVERIGARAPRRYHSIAQVYCDAEQDAPESAPQNPEATAGQLRAALLDSVRHHLVSDVPVGAFLSGGIDSTSLVGLMREAGQQDIQTVTLTFDEFRGGSEDEAPMAAECARLYGVRNVARRVGADEFQSDLPAILAAMDQPSIDGVNMWFAAKAARELGLKVAVSGLGGDELFGGYPSFRDVPRWVGAFGALAALPGLGRMSRALARPLAPRFDISPKAVGMIEYGGDYAGAYLLRRAVFMPWELADILGPEMARDGLRRLAPLALIGREMNPRPATARARVAALESALYMKNQLLRDADWASMAHGLEVRVPLVDAVLLRRVAQLGRATAITKAMLADAVSPSLPLSIRNRPKTGFTTPVALWRANVAAPPPRAGARGRDWARPWARTIMGPDSSADAPAGEALA